LAGVVLLENRSTWGGSWRARSYDRNTGRIAVFNSCFSRSASAFRSLAWALAASTSPIQTLARVHGGRQAAAVML